MNGLDCQDVYKEHTNSHSKITCTDEDGYTVISTVGNIKNGSKPLPFHKRNPYTMHNIRLWQSRNGSTIVLLSDEYEDCTVKMPYICKVCGNKDSINWSMMQDGNGCNVCGKKKTLVGYNDIATSRPDLVKYFLNKEDCKLYTENSNTRVDLKCPECKYIKKQYLISNLSRIGFICPCCSDTVSTPERFIANVLIQLGLYFVWQYSPDWAGLKSYDFFININGDTTIIEAHGIQHYCKKHSISDFDKLIESDRIKKELAFKNNINNYIEVGCVKSEFETLKDSCINSLGNIFDLSSIDWVKTWRDSQRKIVFDICKAWEARSNTDTTQTIADLFDIYPNRVRKILHCGTLIGICNYDPIAEKSKVSSRNVIKMHESNNKRTSRIST